MQYDYQPGDVLVSKKGAITHLKYISEAPPLKHNIRRIVVECQKCGAVVTKCLATIIAGKVMACGASSCRTANPTITTKRAYCTGDRTTEHTTYVGEDLERSRPHAKGYRRYMYVRCDCGVIFSTRVDIKQDLGCTECNKRLKRECLEDIYCETNAKHLFST